MITDKNKAINDLNDKIKALHKDLIMLKKATDYYLKGENSDSPCTFCEPYFMKKYIDFLKSRYIQIKEHACTYRFKSNPLVNNHEVQKLFIELSGINEMLKISTAYISHYIFEKDKHE